jgi:hypothetical protein
VDTIVVSQTPAICFTTHTENRESFLKQLLTPFQRENSSARPQSIHQSTTIAPLRQLISAGEIVNIQH